MILPLADRAALIVGRTHKREGSDRPLTHQLGWELRIDSGDLLMTQICQSDREIEDVAYEWKRAMIEKGWSGDVRAEAEERARRMLPSMFGVRDADAYDVGRATAGNF